jgi:transposase
LRVRQIFRSGWVELSRWWKLRNLPKRGTSWRVDAGYQGENFARVIEQLCGAKVEVIKRSETAFQVLPKRWIVELFFRLVKPLPPSEQGLWTVTRSQWNDDLCSNDSFDAETVDETLGLTFRTLKCHTTNFGSLVKLGLRSQV